IAGELARCDMDSLSSVVSDRTGKSTREVVESLVEGVSRDFRDTPSATPSEGVPERGWDGLADGDHRAAGTALATATARAQAPATPADGGTLFEEPKKARRKSGVYSDEFDTAWAAFPKYGRQAKKVAAEAYDRALERADAATILAGIERYSAYVEQTDVKCK